MTEPVTLIVPVLRRPHRVEPLIDSIEKATPEPHRTLFVADQDDEAELDALRVAGAEWITVDQPRNYAGKINAGYRQTTTPFFFTGADDLDFHADWYRRARGYMVGDVDVVGTNDICNPRVMTGQHSTHTLVRRSYIQTMSGVIDRPDVVLNVNYAHEYCNPPEAPIWMGDLTFKSLGEVRVGDEVIGWAQGENLRRSRSDGKGTSRYPREALSVAVVLNIRVRQSPIVKVTMESGRVLRCTPDHQWLNGRRPGRDHSKHWITPKVGQDLSHVIDEPDPTPPGLERIAGWVGGMYDGEGSWIQIAQCPKANPDICAELVAALNKLDIPHTVGGYAGNFVTLTGGRQAYLSFLNKCQPVKRSSIVNQIIGTKRFGARDQIVSVEPDGAGEVISMTTTTGNYVAWGYASRNCDDEFVQTAMFRGRYAHAYDAIVEHLHPLVNKAPDDDVYRLGRSRTSRSRQLFRQRQHLWR